MSCYIKEKIKMKENETLKKEKKSVDNDSDFDESDIQRR